jgi:hypothetical protein
MVHDAPRAKDKAPRIPLSIFVEEGFWLAQGAWTHISELKSALSGSIENTSIQSD